MDELRASVRLTCAIYGVGHFVAENMSKVELQIKHWMAVAEPMALQSAYVLQKVFVERYMRDTAAATLTP